MRPSLMSLAAVALAAVVTTAALPGAETALAQSKQDLVRSLSRGKTRSLTVPRPDAQKTRGLIDSLRRKKTRQITVEEREQVAKVVQENALPAVDLEVYFAYDSAAIEREALPKLTTLGQALSDPRLKGKTFLIAGHTDARGSDEYNQKLSERRADAIKEFLVRTYDLDPATLIAIGYGEEQLKLPEYPEDGKNRRVQIVNLAE